MSWDSLCPFCLFVDLEWDEAKNYSSNCRSGFLYVSCIYFTIVNASEISSSILIAGEM